jgi:hypothetical protein
MKVSAAIEVTLALLAQAQRISTLVAAAQAANRTDLLPEEYDAILADDDKARADLVAAIALAKSQGR